MPNPPAANPLVAERAPWRSSQSCVTRGQQPIGNPSDSCHLFCTPGNPCATPILTRGEGSFSYQGVSTRGVRHPPVFGEDRSLILDMIVRKTNSCRPSCWLLCPPGSKAHFAQSQSLEQSKSTPTPASTILFKIITFVIRKPLNHLTVIAKKS